MNILRAACGCMAASMVVCAAALLGLAYGTEDTARFMSKWKNMIAEGDPFHNPNYSLSSRSFGLRSDFIVLREPQYRITHYDG